IEIAQHHTGIRDCRDCTTPPIASWTRIGAGTLRPHMQPTASVHPGKTASPGPHRTDVNHRHAQRVTRHTPLTREERFALPYQRHITARATNIECNQVAPMRLLPGKAPPDHPGRWP